MENVTHNKLSDNYPRALAHRVDALVVGAQIVPRKTPDEAVLPLIGVQHVAGFELAVDPKLLRGMMKMHSDDELQVLVGVDARAPTSGWTCEVTWRALFLATHSIEDVIARTMQITTELSALGTSPQSTRVRRLDLAVDLEHCAFTQNDNDALVTVSRARDLHFVGEQFSGYTLGHSDVRARIYDKTLELLEVQGIESTKTRTEHAQWKERGWSGGDVWRVEAQLRRAVLERFGVDQLSDVTPPKLAALWAYFSDDWLRLVDTSTATRTERATNDVRWDEVQRGWSGTLDVPAVLAPREHPGAELDAALGTLLSALRRSGRLPAITPANGLDAFMSFLDATLDAARAYAPHLLAEWPLRQERARGASSASGTTTRSRSARDVTRAVEPVSGALSLLAAAEEAAC